MRVATDRRRRATSRFETPTKFGIGAKGVELCAGWLGAGMGSCAGALSLAAAFVRGGVLLGRGATYLRRGG